MTEHEKRGLSKTLIFQFMQANSSCHPGKEGMKLAHIFRACGFDWGEYKNVTSSSQQYWVGAIVRELEAEGKIERVSESGPWRLL